MFGADHIIMGTDYPFDMADYDPVGHVANTESLDAKTVAAICGGNAKKLLGLLRHGRVCPAIHVFVHEQRRRGCPAKAGHDGESKSIIAVSVSTASGVRWRAAYSRSASVLRSACT